MYPVILQLQFCNCNSFQYVVKVFQYHIKSVLLIDNSNCCIVLFVALPSLSHQKSHSRISLLWSLTHVKRYQRSPSNVKSLKKDLETAEVCS